MILEVFIEFFRVKIIIGLSKNHCDLILTVGFDLSQNNRYISDISDILPIYIRYFTDIFPKIPAHGLVKYSLEISSKYPEFMIFQRFFRFFDQPTIG